jgi:hypothetical protein
MIIWVYGKPDAVEPSLCSAPELSIIHRYSHKSTELALRRRRRKGREEMDLQKQRLEEARRTILQRRQQSFCFVPPIRYGILLIQCAPSSETWAISITVTLPARWNPSSRYVTHSRFKATCFASLEEIQRTCPCLTKSKCWASCQPSPKSTETSQHPQRHHFASVKHCNCGHVTRDQIIDTVGGVVEQAARKIHGGEPTAAGLHCMD